MSNTFNALLLALSLVVGLGACATPPMSDADVGARGKRGGDVSGEVGNEDFQTNVTYGTGTSVMSQPRHMRQFQHQQAGDVKATVDFGHLQAAAQEYAAIMHAPDPVQDELVRNLREARETPDLSDDAAALAALQAHHAAKLERATAAANEARAAAQGQFKALEWMIVTNNEVNSRHVGVPERAPSDAEAAAIAEGTKHVMEPATKAASGVFSGVSD